MNDLLLALNAAAEITRLADSTEDAILAAVGQQLTRLNLRGGLSMLTPGGDRFVIRMAVFPGSALVTLEQLTGRRVVGHTFARSQLASHHQALTTRQTLFLPDGSAMTRELLPARAPARALAGPLIRMLGQDPVIVAPVMANGSVLGVLSVSGPDLTPDDVPVMIALSDHIAIALANARLYQAAQQRLRRLHALQAIYLSLNRAASLDEALASTLTETLAAFGLTTGWISLRDERERGSLRVARWAGPTGPASPAPVADARCPDDHAGCPAEPPCECQAPFLADPRAPATLRAACGWLRRLGPDFVAHAAIPIQSGDQLLGLLNLARGSADPALDEDDLAALATLGQQLAAALGRLRAQAATDDSLDREQRLNQLMRTLSSTLNLPATLHNTVCLAAQLVGAEACALALLASDEQSLTYPYIYHLPEAVTQLVTPKGKGLAWPVIDGRESLLVDDYPAEREAVPALVAAGVRTLLGVPVMAGDTIIGVLGLAMLTPGRKFHARDRILAESIGRQAGVTIQNARLFEAVHASEIRHRALSELISDYAYADRVDPDGQAVLEWVSDAFTRFTGYTLPDLANPGIWKQMVHPDDQPAAGERRAALLAGQNSVGEYRLLTRRGETHWVREYARPIWDAAQGRVTHIYSAAQDLTERRQAELLSRKYQLLASHSADLILFVRLRDQRILEANDAAAQAYGYARDELLGLTIRDLRGAETPSPILDHAAEVQQGNFTFADVHRRRDGRTFPVEVSANGVILDGETVFLSIIRDISERHQASAALRESEARYRHLFDAMPSGVALHEIICDAAGQPVDYRFLEVNPAFERLTGLSAAALIGRTAREALPGLEPLWIQRYGAVALTGAPAQFDSFSGNLDQQFEVTAYCPRPGQFVAVFQDVTERQQAEDRLRQLSRAVEQSPVTIVITDTAGRIQYANPKFTETSGYTLAEARGHNPRLLKSGETPSAEYQRLWATITAGGEWRGEFHNRRKNGELYWESAVLSPILDAAGRITHFLAVKEDITERKAAEAALRAREAQLQAAVRVASLGVFDHDQLAETIYWSPRQREICGVDPDQRASLPGYLSLVYPDDRAAVLDSVQRAHDPAGDGVWDVEHRLVRPGGEVRWLSAKSQTYFAGEGAARRAVRTVGATLDITERKTAEAALRLTQFSVDHASAGVLRLDRDARIVAANVQICRMLGYTAAELTQRHIYDLDPNFPLDTWRRHRQHLSEVGTAIFETVHRRRDGSLLPVQVTNSYIEFEGDQYSIAFVQDITERQRAEAARRDSQARLDGIVSTAMDGIITLDEAQRIILFNAAAEQVFGCAAAEVLGQRLDRFLPDGLGDAHRLSLAQFAWTGPSRRTMGQPLALRARRANGEEFSMEASISRTEVGGQQLFTVILRDVTERQRAEAALRDSEHQLSALVASLDDLVFELDEAGTYLRIWAADERLLVRPKTEMLGQTVSAMLGPDAAPAFLAGLRQTLETGRSVELEYPLTVQSGPAWFQARFSPMAADSGARPTVSVVVRDITRRRRGEAALRESERQLSALVASLDDIVFELDQQSTVLHIWAADESLLVRPPAEMLGRTMAEILGAEAGRQFVDAIRRAFDSAQPVEMEYPLDVLSGHRWFQARVSAMQPGPDARPSVSMFVRDITERRRAAAALADSEHKFRSFVEQSLAGFTLTDEQGLISEWNRARELITGVSRDQVLGRPYWDVQRDLMPPAEQSPERYANNRQIILDALRTGQAPFFDKGLEGHILKPDGAYRTLQQVVFPIHTDQGFCLGSVSYDVTEQLQRERELESLAVVSAALRAAPTRAEMLPIILDQVRELLRADGTALDLFDPASGDVVIEAARGAWTPIAGQRIPAGQAVLEQVLRTGQPYLSEAPATDPHLVFKDYLAGVRAMAGVPLIVEGQAFGGLWVGRAAPFRADEIRLATSLADMAASALHRANLHEQTERRLQQLMALRAVDAAINSSMGLAITLNVVLDQVMGQLRTAAAAIWLLKAETDDLEFATGRGYITDASGVRGLGSAYARQVLLERRLVRQTELLSPELDGARQTYYGLPLTSKGQVVGVLEVFHGAAVQSDSDWVEFLETLAGQAAIAIDNAGLVDGLQRSNYELIQAYDATIEGWTRALDLRDRETEGHSQRVTTLTLELAVAMGMQAQQLEHIRRGALLHDIGKMGVPDSILLKPGPLTSDEWVAMRLHPTFAYKMLKPIAYLAPALEIPYCHHEKWDGTGYPRGLKGEAIPLAARIFALVDVWDALRSDRPYRPAWPADKVREHIRALAGTHFDPRVVRAALAMGMLGHDEPAGESEGSLA